MYRAGRGTAVMARKPLSLYIAGQGISNLGESIRFVAVTVLLFKLTGSGVSTSLCIAFSILPSILLSPLAGTLGDMFSEKYMLSIVDLLRCAVVMFLISETEVLHIYFLILLLAGLDMFYAPARRKFILSMTGKNGVLKANSLLTGVTGAAYLAGPVIAGILTENFSPDTAFLVNAITYFISSILTLLIKIPARNTSVNIKPSINRKMSLNKRITKEILSGFVYIKRNGPVKEVILTGLVASVCAVSINMAFYPFAFEVLKVTTAGWSFMISVYYGTNLLAMALMAFFNRKSADVLWRFLHKGLLITAVIWLVYSVAIGFEAVVLLQFLEGTIMALCGIIIASRMQSISDRDFIARVGGINDIFSNVGKLAGMGLSYALLVFESCRSVFFVISLIMIIFSMYCIAIDRSKARR